MDSTISAAMSRGATQYFEARSWLHRVSRGRKGAYCSFVSGPVQRRQDEILCAKCKLLRGEQRLLLRARRLSSSAWAAARRARAAAEEARTARVITNASRATPATASTSARGSRMSCFSLFPIFQPDGNQLRDTGLLHRHSVQDIGPRDRPLVVGDDDEL